MSNKAKKTIGIILAVVLFLSLVAFVAWGFSHIWDWGIAILISFGVFVIAGVFAAFVGLAVHLITKD